MPCAGVKVSPARRPASPPAVPPPPVDTAAAPNEDAWGQVTSKRHTRTLRAGYGIQTEAFEETGNLMFGLATPEKEESPTSLHRTLSAQASSSSPAPVQSARAQNAHEWLFEIRIEASNGSSANQTVQCVPVYALPSLSGGNASVRALVLKGI